MKHSNKPQPRLFEPAEDEIQKYAYFLWQEEGRPAGRDLEIWLIAKELARHHVVEKRSRPVPRRRVLV
jgi:hypothetical protein